MPLYTYKCSKCEHVFEKITQSYVRAIPCEKCSDIAQRQISAPGGFILKGDGWYKGSASKPDN